MTVILYLRLGGGVGKHWSWDIDELLGTFASEALAMTVPHLGASEHECTTKQKPALTVTFSMHGCERIFGHGITGY